MNAPPQAAPGISEPGVRGSGIRGIRRVWFLPIHQSSQKSSQLEARARVTAPRQADGRGGGRRGGAQRGELLGFGCAGEAGGGERDGNKGIAPGGCAGIAARVVRLDPGERLGLRA